MGEGGKGRARSSSAEQDKRTEMACMYSGSSPPKTQRISLMKRLAKFVSEKKIPGKMPDLNDDTKTSSRPPLTNLMGSNTSLSSGSSIRSYVDIVKAGLSHQSVDDLKLNFSK